MGLSPTTITRWLRRAGRRLHNRQSRDSPCDRPADSSTSPLASDSDLTPDTTSFDGLTYRIQDRLLGIIPTAQWTAFSSTAMVGLPIIPLFNPLNPNDWFKGIIDTLATGLTNVLGTLFVGMVKQFLVITPMYYQGGANATFMQNLQYAMILFPIVIVLGTISALFSEAPEGSYMRQAIRIVKALFALALIRPFIHVAVVLTNAATKLVMPETYAISLAGPVFQNAIGDIMGSALAAVLVYLAAGTVSLLAIALVVMILFLRIFMIHLIYTAFPILLVMWYADWGPLRYGNDVAMFLFKVTAYLLLAGPVIALALQTGCSMSAPNICAAQASGSAHGAQALTAGIDPSQNKLVLWKRFLGWLSGLGLAGFIGIQALSMGGSSAGHLMGLGGLSAMRGGGGDGSGSGASGGGGGGGPTPPGGGGGAGQHTLRNFGGGAGNGPNAFGPQGSPKPEFHPRQTAGSAKASLKQRASSARNTARSRAQRAHRGVKSRKDWMSNATWKQGTRAGAEAAGGGLAIGAREARVGVSHVKDNLNEPIMNWPGHAYRRMKNGQWNPPDDDLGAAANPGAGASNEPLALPAGPQALPEGDTWSPEYEDRDANPEEAKSIAGGGAGFEKANAGSVSSTVQARYESMMAQDRKKLEQMRPDLIGGGGGGSSSHPSPSEEQIQKSVDEYVDRTRNNGS